jgi:hypothetical protein
MSLPLSHLEKTQSREHPHPARSFEYVYVSDYVTITEENLYLSRPFVTGSNSGFTYY